MKITVVCGNGLGTSLLMEMAIEKIIKDLQVEGEVEHTDLGSAKSMTSDIYVGTKDITEQLIAQGIEGEIVSLDNMIDKVAMKEKLSIALTKLGVL